MHCAEMAHSTARSRRRDGLGENEHSFAAGRDNLSQSRCLQRGLPLQDNVR